MARYYPGFLAAFFIVLLRIAIGWHFLNEGVEKYQATQSGKDPFSAEIYLRNSAGPLAPYFRDLLPDGDSRELLDLDALKTRWREDLDRITGHYGFDSEQGKQAIEIYEKSCTWANYWFNNAENREAREKYLHDLEKVEKIEQNTNALSYERERAWEARRSLEADRKAVTKPILEQGEAMREAIAGRATPEQKAAAGELRPPLTSLDVANWLTIYGLIAMGFCLIAGFLTPFSALCAASFLAMIYFSMPPWPGTPPNPKAEGHYWIVSKNLIEMIACLVIATTPSGHWIGLDALVFGGRRRRRLARAAAAGEQHEPAHA